MHFWLGPAETFGYTAASSVTRRRSSVVERILGKAEVGSSILPGGTTLTPWIYKGVSEKSETTPSRGPDRNHREHFKSDFHLLETSLNRATNPRDRALHEASLSAAT